MFEFAYSTPECIYRLPKVIRCRTETPATCNLEEYAYRLPIKGRAGKIRSIAFLNRNTPSLCDLHTSSPWQRKLRRVLDAGQPRRRLMTGHDLSGFVYAAAKMGAARSPRFPLDKLHNQLSERLVIFTPSGAQVDALMDLARKAIPRLADNSIVHRVVSHNPDTLWAITRRSHYKSTAAEGEGLVAFLMLNDIGLKSLVQGTFNAADPDLSMIVRQHEKPSGIYVWGIHSPGIIAGGVALTVEKISTKLYRDVDVYARAATAQGLRLMQTMGFEPGAEYCGLRNPNVHVYRRTQGIAQTPPIYDNYRS